MPLKTSSMKALPDSIQTLAEVIGESAALTLVRAWPPTPSSTTGRHRVIVYVPSTLPDQHRLIDILGRDVAQRLVTHFGGELLFLAQRAGLKVGEFGVEWEHQPDSRITYNLRKSLRIFTELFKVRWLHRFGR